MLDQKIFFMSTRNGKIARLPRDIRDELNRRLDNGEGESALLPWLNALPAVQAVLAVQFGASPVSQQNLTKWRQGGYQHWLKQHEHNQIVRELAQHAGEFASHPGASGLANNMSTVLMVELAVSANAACKEPAGPAERCERLRELLHTVSEVRREDCRAGRLALNQELQAAGPAGADAEKQTKTN
jgi:hypothetical protein